MSYRIISIQQKEEWMQLVRRCLIYDFYHTWYYHSLEQEGGEPFLFVYQMDEQIIVFPLLRKRIEGTSFQDCTSVYGYPGPISNVDFADMEEEMLKDFKIHFLNFLKSQGKISVFSRLHPIINHEILLEQFGGLFENGRTIIIDLKNSIEDQRSKYRRRFRTKIRHLRNKGYQLKVASSDDEVRSFVNIYLANMRRVEAKKYYFFDEEYFFNLLRATEFKCILLLAYYDSEITSGVLLTYSNKIMQFHLAATHESYLNDGPMKVLIDEASVLGRDQGIDYLHLGGGLGGEKDSLYQFKSGFSDQSLSFKTWRFKADETSYDLMVDDRGLTNSFNSDFFPLYRMAVSLD